MVEQRGDEPGHDHDWRRCRSVVQQKKAFQRSMVLAHAAGRCMAWHPHGLPSPLCDGNRNSTACRQQPASSSTWVLGSMRRPCLRRWSSKRNEWMVMISKTLTMRDAPIRLSGFARVEVEVRVPGSRETPQDSKGWMYVWCDEKTKHAFCDETTSGIALVALAAS